MRWFWPFLLIVALIPGLLWAETQDTQAGTQADKGWLTDFLEQNLSGTGRKVTIDGFEGALSSKAKIRQLTIADGSGVWLTLKGVTLDWSRTALLTGKVQVQELTADEIDLPRLPKSPPATPSAPSSQASGFALPELPVSISIGKIEAKKVVLGKPVLGQAATVKVSGSASLAGGQGAAKISLQRIDGKTGLIAFAASYDNTTQQLALNLNMHEAAGGIVSTLAGLPDAPELALDVQGSGPLDKFDAALRLATDGKPRLQGTLALRGEAGADGKITRRFTADLGGDMAPLFAPEYQAFFGTDMALKLVGQSLPSGQVQLSTLDLKARQMALRGQVDIGADGMPSRIDLTGKLASADGTPVLLPLPGRKTQVARGDISLRYDQAKGDGWQGQATLSGFKRPGMALGRVVLTGKGRIAPLATGDTARGIEGTLDVQTSGIAPAEKALAEALGKALTARLRFAYRPGKPLELPQVQITGEGLDLTGQGRLSGLQSAAEVTGSATMRATDLSRFSGLAGRSLGGAATAHVTGSAALLAGTFDATAAVDGQGLRVGIPQLDALLQGASHVELSARRDTSGTTLRAFHVAAQSLQASAEGSVSPQKTDLTAQFAFADLGQLGAGYGGALDAEAKLTGSVDSQNLVLKATGRDLAVGQTMASRLLRGATRLSLDVRRTNGVIGVNGFSLTNPQLQASARPSGANPAALAVKARLSDLALLASGFSGPVEAEGTVAQGAKGYDLDLRATGPGGIDTQVKGSVAADGGAADLTVTGSARAELVNPLIAPRSVSGAVGFDLALRGTLALSSLSGRVTATELKAAAPLLGLSATGGTLDVALGGDSARLTGGLQVGGGTIRLSGPVGMSPPYVSDLGITVAHVGLKDPQLFSTSASGTLTVKGPLAGGAAIAGRLTLGTTELRVPSSTPGGGTIPEGLVQKGATAAVRATLQRAGLGTKPKTRDTAPPARPFGLNIVIAAPAQVFVRGRGLDAELGGQIALTGTSADIVPIGGFDLRRGRLEILGKRLDLTEGSLRLQGRFIPWVHLVASSSSDGVTANVNVDGDASDPQITFTSSPALPQDEVLSHLLFGRGLSKISPFQAAQLAAAVATLAGKGGEGIVARLRQGFGLDDLDIQTNAQGQTSVKLGKYLTKRIYTDVTVGQDGTSQIDLNLDVTKSVTLKGKAASDGNTGIGVYYQKDY